MSIPREDAEDILKYLREPKFVLAKMPGKMGGGGTALRISDIVPNFVIGDGTTRTVVYVPRYGDIHVEEFLKECKEMGLEV